MINRTRQSEMFDRAVPYARRLQEVSDPSIRKNLRLLRDAWVMLANGSETMTEETLASEVARIELMEIKLGPSILN